MRTARFQDGRIMEPTREEEGFRLQPTSLIHACRASRAAAVISNCTGSWVLCCVTVRASQPGPPDRRLGR